MKKVKASLKIIPQLSIGIKNLQKTDIGLQKLVWGSAIIVEMELKRI